MLRPALAGIAVLAALALLTGDSLTAALTKPTLRVTAKTDHDDLGGLDATPRDAVRYAGQPVAGRRRRSRCRRRRPARWHRGRRRRGRRAASATRPTRGLSSWRRGGATRAGTRPSATSSTVVTDADRIAPSTPGNLRRHRRDGCRRSSLAWDASSDNAGIAEYQLVDSRPVQGSTVWIEPDLGIDIVGHRAALRRRVRRSRVRRRRDSRLQPLAVAPRRSRRRTLASTDTTPPSAPNTTCESTTPTAAATRRHATGTQSTDRPGTPHWRGDPAVTSVLINAPRPDPSGWSPVRRCGVGRWITYGRRRRRRTRSCCAAIDSAGNVSAPSAPYTLNLNTAC